MAPVSTTAHIQNIFLALEQLDHFEYSSIQLHTFYQNTNPSKSSSTKTRSSAYQAFRAENKGNKDAPKWSDIKDDLQEFSKYETLAISLNLQRGFTTQDPKILNKHKSEQRKLVLQAAIDFEKRKKKTTHTFDDIDINKDGVITREEFDKFNLEESEPPVEVEESEPPAKVEESEPPAKVEESEPPAKVEESEPPIEVEESEPPIEVEESEPPIEVEESEPPVEVEESEPPVEVEESEPPVEVEESEPPIEVEESEPPIEVEESEPPVEVEESEPPVEVEESEPPVEVEESEPPVEVEESEPETEENSDESDDPLARLNLHQDEKPLYTGKNNSSALSNFKQWILNENQLSFNSTIPNSDMKEYKNKYNFDKNKYLLDDECPWFEFIKNNMSIQ